MPEITALQKEIEHDHQTLQRLEDRQERHGDILDDQAALLIQHGEAITQIKITLSALSEASTSSAIQSGRLQSEVEALRKEVERMNSGQQRILLILTVAIVTLAGASRVIEVVGAM
jgi:chromosome segregation ATPase